MLDKTTKTIINNARNILVGKVPNPQSQVDLITIAMIYKFMDDMDTQNIELGGNRVYFTDDLAPFAWKKLLDSKAGHFERLNLYSQALDKLQIAKQVPQLFRDIFKGAFLPFRDGATLTMFLKEIDNFSYSNSENLGNAFEYLLSIMGAQGDAGQFRTPRHIIDFIVEVVNPTKTDTILDPACGTAGFLISAYKHIIKQAEAQNEKLSPKEMKAITDNIVGYDISPDMKKLALVNLYLHQFPKPKIYEYDTLTQEERWSDKFNVILANPPFMSPKGGIIPHKKFGVKANRAEVLFADYIMEHLTLNGKAGVVVPDGIIFQSATAYKALRKMMVEEQYLYAVVSLPSGVFNPYSGVKTSILFFDRNLAKISKDILFIKVENDGFDLGAQRREINENDLPKSIEILKEYQQCLLSGQPFDDKKYSKSLLVSKDKISQDSDYNLTAARYEQTIDHSNCQYEMVKLGDISEVCSGNSAPQNSKVFENGIYPFCRTSDVGKAHISTNLIEIKDKINEQGISGLTLFPQNTILFPKSGASILLNHRAILGIASYVSSHLAAIVSKEEYIIPKFLFYLLCFVDAKKLIPDSGYPSLRLSDIAKVELPLPPLDVQEEIVKELDQYQAIIDGAQKIIDNWKPTFTINPNWKKVPFIEQIENVKYTNKIQNNQFLKKGKYPIIDQSEKYIAGYWNDKADVFYIKKPVIIFGDHTKHIKYIDFDFVLGADGVKILQPNMLWDSKFFYYTLLSIKIKDLGYARHFKELKEKEMYRPSLEEQKVIVEQLEKEEQYIDACKSLIELNKQKIADKIKTIWNCNG